MARRWHSPPFIRRAQRSRLHWCAPGDQSAIRHDLFVDMSLSDLLSICSYSKLLLLALKKIGINRVMINLMVLLLLLQRRSSECHPRHRGRICPVTDTKTTAVRISVWGALQSRMLTGGSLWTSKSMNLKGLWREELGQRHTWRNQWRWFLLEWTTTPTTISKEMGSRYDFAFFRTFLSLRRIKYWQTSTGNLLCFEICTQH